MKNINKTAFIIGTTIATAAMSTAMADSNPFAISDLSSGYMNVAEADSMQENMGKMKEASCGEGKCGANKAKTMMEKKAEGKCGENKTKTMMEKQTADKVEKITEGACGTDKTMGKMKEGSCGEGKGKEGSCGVMNMMSDWF